MIDYLRLEVPSSSSASLGKPKSVRPFSGRLGALMPFDPKFHRNSQLEDTYNAPNPSYLMSCPSLFLVGFAVTLRLERPGPIGLLFSGIVIKAKMEG
jgi:hypothetical protein